MPRRGKSLNMPRDSYRRSRRFKLVPKQHIKYEGLQPMTTKRYRRQMRFFFIYLSDRNIDLPSDMTDLDETVGEYINHLYQDDYPVNYGNDLVSGLKRFYPKCRRHLETSSTYMRSWNKSLNRRRALPLPADLLMAMASLALVKNNKRLALALLLGYCGLLRTGEILGLTQTTIAIHGKNELMSLSLPESKSGHRRGEAESVLIYDDMIISLGTQVLSGLKEGENLLNMNFRDFSNRLCDLAANCGCADPTLTPYCLRRGGATWHFTKYQCYDTTQELGRWSNVKTAKQYINQAVSDVAGVKIPNWGKSRIERLCRILPPLIQGL